MQVHPHDNHKEHLSISVHFQSSGSTVPFSCLPPVRLLLFQKVHPPPTDNVAAFPLFLHSFDLTVHPPAEKLRISPFSRRLLLTSDSSFHCQMEKKSPTLSTKLAVPKIPAVFIHQKSLKCCLKKLWITISELRLTANTAFNQRCHNPSAQILIKDSQKLIVGRVDLIEQMKKAGRRREIEPHCRPVASSFMSGPCSSAHSDGMHSWFQRVWPLRTTDGGVLVIFRLSPDTSTGSSRSACKCVHSRTNEMSTAAKRFKWNAVKYILFFKKIWKSAHSPSWAPRPKTSDAEQPIPINFDANHLSCNWRIPATTEPHLNFKFPHRDYSRINSAKTFNKKSTEEGNKRAKKFKLGPRGQR